MVADAIRNVKRALPPYWRFRLSWSVEARTSRSPSGLSTVKPGFTASTLAYVSGVGSWCVTSPESRSSPSRSEREPQLAASRRHVVAAERVVGMVEVADEPIPNPAQDGRAAAQPALHERPAHSCLGAQRLQVSEPDALRGGERLARRLRDHVQRAADRVAAVERPLRPAQHLDPLEVQEVAEHHRRPREVHAVQVHGRARVGAGEDDVRPDAADRELGEAGVLGEGDAGRPPGRVLHARGAPSAPARLPSTR